MKFYFNIEGISMELNNEDEADQVCTTLTNYLKAMGIKDADVYFSDEEFYKKEHNI